MGVESIVVAGRDAWLKAYDQGDNRRLALGLLDAVARRLDIDALRPPPHPGGGAAKRIEARRIRELAALGVRVPRVLGEGESTLLLSDLGTTLATRLRDAGDDAAGVDALTARAVAAMLRRIDPELPVQLDWFGDRSPLVPTAPGVPEPRNRRAEILIL